MRRVAAIFDLDGTLLPHTSAERLFVAAALRNGTLAPWRAAGGMLAAVAGWLSGRTPGLAAAKDYLRGSLCEPLETLGVHCVRTAVWPRLRPDLMTALEAHRGRGDVIVLMSGTPDFLGMEVARLLDAEFAITAQLVRRAGRFTGQVVAPHPHGAGKVAALQALAAGSGLDLARSHAYANRGSDAQHLELVGSPHAVSPDRGLRRAALRRGWEVIDDG
jgi:HAD superfamily hydrolase (TIGR01490 family)